jgi:hypothetical protein
LIDLSQEETSFIGSTIGGIVTPILTAFSIYYLLAAFRMQAETVRMQMENNKDQRIKSDVDIVFMLLNQLDVEYNQFDYAEISTRNGRRVWSGYDAFLFYSQSFRSMAKDEDALAIFKVDAESDKINYLITSFSLIKEHVLNSNLSGSVQGILLRKLSLFYKTKFAYPMGIIIGILSAHQDDPMVTELIKVHESEIDGQNHA